MRNATIQRKQRGFSITALALVASLGLLGATPAQADNDFANGFEDQMGRLFAVEAFQFGRLVIAAGLHGHVAPYAPVWPTPYGVSTGYGYSVRDRHPARAHRPPHHRAVRRHHKRHARRDHYVDHDRDRRHRDGRHERSDRSDRRRTRGR